MVSLYGLEGLGFRLATGSEMQQYGGFPKAGGTLFGGVPRRRILVF